MLVKHAIVSLGIITLIKVSAVGADFSVVGPKMQEFVDKGEVAGVVTLVATKDKVLFINAVGKSDLAAGQALKTDDLFWIASMSKPMTSVCAGMLVDEGKLAWDDPVEKYIPEFKNITVLPRNARGREAGMTQEPQALSRPILLRDLLTHTSGLAEYTKTDPHWTLAQFAQQIASQHSQFQPGGRWSYSTAGIDAVGRVVEVVSGMPLELFIQSRLFDPLGMKDTCWWLTDANKARFAHPYRLNDQTKKLEDARIPYFYGGEPADAKRPPLGGAGIISTAEDVTKFYQMLLNGGTLSGKRILKPETVATMTSVQSGTFVARAGEPWGYGMAVVKDPHGQPFNRIFGEGTFGHGGALGTQSWADPKHGLIYILMIECAGLRDPDGSDTRLAFQEAAAKAALPGN